jgi:surfeit locus 1 family protein
MPIRFKLRWVPLVATVIVVAAGVVLGQWQTRRGDEKQAILMRMDERQAAPAITFGPALWQADLHEQEFRRIRLKGEFITQWTTYLDNRPYNGAPGLYVLTPFKIADSEHSVLVERGWVPLNLTDRSNVPALPPPSGMQEIEGVLRLGAGHLLQLGKADVPRPGALMQNLEIPAFAKASGFGLLPFVIEQHADAGNTHDGLTRDWPAPALGIERHRGYAVQWYALALMAILFFVVTGFRSGKKSSTDSAAS